MGNRAVITFDAKLTENSVGIYLHHNGGPESVVAFCDAAIQLGLPIGDRTYLPARFVQMLGNFFGGTLSLGLGLLRQLDCNNGDNGLYAVSWAEDGKSFQVIQWNGREADIVLGRPGVVLNQYEIRQHAYFTASPKMVEITMKQNPMFKGCAA